MVGSPNAGCWATCRSSWNNSHKKLHFDLHPYTHTFDIEAGGGFTHCLHKCFDAEVLDRKVGWTNRRQGLRGILRIRKLPVQLEARTGSDLEAGVGHELFSSTGQTNT